MKILAIDTSCDETAAAVTDGRRVLSNIIWSQASAHAEFGGVMPSLAQRMHQERIDWVVENALKKSKLTFDQLEAIAVTVGPGLSIALGVGVSKAKEIAEKYKKPLIPVNHVEAHLLSPFAEPKGGKEIKITFPAYGLCVSGKNTEFVQINSIGNYTVLAECVDDAIGESIDKAARMLGLGYPGGAIMEKFAKLGSADNFILPIPLVGQEKRMIFSYSGLKTSFYRLIEKHKNIDSNFPNKDEVYNLASVFLDVAFKHIERVLSFYMTKNISAKPKYLLLGGGVAINSNLRARLRRLGEKFGWSLHIPYGKKLFGDNSAMIGVTAFLKIESENLKLENYLSTDSIDRNPKLKLNDALWRKDSN